MPLRLSYNLMHEQPGIAMGYSISAIILCCHAQIFCVKVRDIDQILIFFNESDDADVGLFCHVLNPWARY